MAYFLTVNRQSRVWGFVFLASGLLTMLAAPLMLVMLGPAAALPFAVASGLVTIYAGYRVWKYAHPEVSIWRELSRRTVAVVTFGVTVGAFLLAMEFPQVVLVIIGVWILVIFATFALLAIAERRSR